MESEGSGRLGLPDSFSDSLGFSVHEIPGGYKAVMQKRIGSKPVLLTTTSDQYLDDFDQAFWWLLILIIIICKLAL